MSVYDYASVIKITFDKAIVSNVDIQTGWQQNVTAETGLTGRASDSYSTSYTPDKAFDGSTSTYWRTSTTLPQWIGFDLGEAKRLGKISVYPYSSYRPRAYQLYGSLDDTDWTLVTSGELTNSTAWKDITFDGVSYRYWRLTILSGWSAGRIYIAEIRAYSELPTYETAGWTVAAKEYNRIPNGELTDITYLVRRVTKSEDNLSVFLWLNLPNRMKNPYGLVTVSYSKQLGNLAGAYSAYVDDFLLQFTPVNITPIFNPNVVEHISAELSIETDMVRIYYSSYQSDNEHLEASLSVATALIHVNDIET